MPPHTARRPALLRAAATGLLSLTLAACATATASGPSAMQETAQPGATATAQAAPTAAQAAPTAPPVGDDPVVAAIGEVAAATDADLTFAVQGTVAEVLVREGEPVTAGQVLARLDTRPFDQGIDEAQAALDIALAQQARLSEAPNAAAVRAARAQVRQAEIAVEQARTRQAEGTRSAEAAVTAAEAQLQATRDQLSRAKTQADAGIQGAAEALVQAQARYAQAKSDWDYVRETGNNPAQPEIVNPSTGGRTDNEVVDSQREQYYAAFVQAESAMRQAEQRVAQAQVDAEQARKAELTGIQAAEQQVAQAQSALGQVRLPEGADQVAVAQAQLEAARAGLAQLTPAPGAADVAQAEASVRRAQVALDRARLNREYAELKAPFDGVVSAVNVDPGDPSAAGGLPAISVVDVERLEVEVRVSDVDIGQVRLGAAAEVFVDSAPGAAFAGTVSYIAPDVTVQAGVRTYLVRIDLAEQGGLRPGQTARAEIAAATGR